MEYWKDGRLRMFLVPGSPQNLSASGGGAGQA